MPTESPTEHQRVLSDCKTATHMPFFDGETLFFCQSGPPIEKTVASRGTIWKSMRRNPELAKHFANLAPSQQIRYRPWKLAYCRMDDKTIHPIATGMPEDGIECSPAFYRENGRVFLSFVGGTPADQGIEYKLYTASGPDFGNLDPVEELPLRPVFFGFVSPHHICWGGGNILNLKEKNSKTEFKLKPDLAMILRVTFQADDPARLLITGVDGDRQYRTILHDLSTGDTLDVLADGPVYKSTLHGDSLVFARKIGNGFEDRELCQGNCTLTPSKIGISKEE